MIKRLVYLFQLTVTNDPLYVQITPGTDLGIFWASVRLMSLLSVCIASIFNVSKLITGSRLPEEFRPRCDVPHIHHVLLPALQQDAVSRKMPINRIVL